MISDNHNKLFSQQKTWKYAPLSLPNTLVASIVLYWLRSGSGQIFKLVRVVLISSVKFSNLKRCFLFRFQKFSVIWYLKNTRFCRFCTVKRSKSAQNFLARFARQFFSEGASCHISKLEPGGSYFVCQTFKLEPGGSYLGGVLNSNTPVLKSTSIFETM